MIHQVAALISDSAFNKLFWFVSLLLCDL